MAEPSFVFPAVRGTQATMEYYVSMVPLETVPKLFMFSNDELPPEIRSQRVLSKSRIPEMRDYIIDNPNSYVFSALTVSVDGDVFFDTVGGQDNYNIGQIRIPMSARFVINDGQHRRAAIEAALRMNQSLKYEHIAIVFFSDLGLKRSQQMFSDLNRHAIRPTKSLNILFDHRDEFSIMVNHMADNLPIFKGLVEKEKSKISNRSKALFTLSGIYRGTKELLNNLDFVDLADKKRLVYSFWEETAKYIEEWQAVRNGQRMSSDLRNQSVCAHSITLLALGRAGNALISNHPDSWNTFLPRLSEINWNKDNTSVWDGRVVINGHISGTRSSEQSLTELIKSVLLSE